MLRTASPFASGMMLEQTFKYHAPKEIVSAPKEYDLKAATDFLWIVGNIVVPIQLSMKSHLGKIANTDERSKAIRGKRCSKTKRFADSIVLISINEENPEKFSPLVEEAIRKMEAKKEEILASKGVVQID